MRRTLVGIVALMGVGLAPAHAQSVTGTVTYAGKVPVLKPIAMDGDPVCAKKHTTPVQNEMLVLGTGNTMGNIMVSVTKGLPAGKTFAAPKTAAVIDQKGCQYAPHVLAVMVNQPVKLRNSDGLLHNVHALPKVNKEFNMAMPANRLEADETFTKEEGVFQMKCDVHPWMQAFIRVYSHPYYAVTKADGKFEIKGLDPGTYTIEAWHERLGVQTATVTVAKGAAPVNFTFKAPAAK